MDAQLRIRIRAAAILHEQLTRRRGQQQDLFLPTNSWQRAVDLLRQRDQTRQRDWFLAAASLAKELNWELGYLHAQIKRIADFQEAEAQRPALPSQAELCRELLALEQEFEDVRYDLKQSLIIVATNAIVLDGRDLGPFEIRLRLKQLHDTPPYRVVALTPNHPAHNDSVTHPHVENDRLCEGEGYQAIQSALSDGRVLDFFLIVSRLLATYSEGQAYVELDKWDGVPCADCDATIRSGDVRHCTECDSQLCDECHEVCNQCNDVYCRTCMSPCTECDLLHCDKCFNRCARCEERVCDSCLADALCSTCQPANPLPSRKQDDAPINQPVRRSQHACVAAH